MVNIIWLFLLVTGVIVAMFTGRIDEVTKAIFTGAETGVTVCLGLISVMVLWLGIMRIAEDAGLLRKVAKLLSPLVRLLFPDVPKDHPALGYIMSNMSANILGLGNAATPMGIKAMQELQKLNPDKDTASPAMCTLLALNTSSITLIPTTLIAIRMNYGSADPVEIVGTTLIATIIATIGAMLLDRWYRNRYIRLKQNPRGPKQPPISSSSKAPKSTAS